MLLKAMEKMMEINSQFCCLLKNEVSFIDPMYGVDFCLLALVLSAMTLSLWSKSVQWVSKRCHSHRVNSALESVAARFTTSLAWKPSERTQRRHKEKKVCERLSVYRGSQEPYPKTSTLLLSYDVASRPTTAPGRCLQC